jgi:hypothetical protein
MAKEAILFRGLTKRGADVMKTTVTQGINGPVSVNDPLGSAAATVGNVANDAWRTVQAWKGKEAPSDISYEAQKWVAQKAKGLVTGVDNKPVVGSFTEAEQARAAATRGSREKG